jgi:purine-binding chemotaxis protein CheW
MSTTLQRSAAVHDDELELVTFFVGPHLLGAEIGRVEEINRHVNPTPVAHAPEAVRGVVNLRGEVVTVLDLRNILGLGRTEIDKQTRNVVVNYGGERVGLLVDRIADVVNTRWSEIKPPPANLSGIAGRFFDGVHEMDRQLLTVLDLDEVLASTADALTL